MEHSSKFTALVIAAAFIAGGTVSKPAVAQQYTGQLMIVAFDFCPRGWAKAEGQILQFTQNDVLFSLLLDRFGGDGRKTFALPDLRGRSVLGVGKAADLEPVAWGQKGGSQSFTLTAEQLPSHTHTLQANSAEATESDPAGNALGASKVYATDTPSANLNSAAIAFSGGAQSIAKRSPFLGLTICIAMVGDYPNRNP